ncbi:MAG: excisionase family DNA-binding protein [Elusimicrobia bacterium]|nr:excisionase family DNA-binding protein [Elusimicrobiota bacterium]
MDPLLISVEEAGKRLGVGRTFAYELVASGELPSVKLGRRRLVPVAALSEYVDRALGATRMATNAPERPEILSIPARNRRFA